MTLSESNETERLIEISEINEGCNSDSCHFGTHTHVNSFRCFTLYNSSLHLCEILFKLHSARYRLYILRRIIVTIFEHKAEMCILYFGIINSYDILKINGLLR